MSLHNHLNNFQSTMIILNKGQFTFTYFLASTKKTQHILMGIRLILMGDIFQRVNFCVVVSIPWIELDMIIDKLSKGFFFEFKCWQLTDCYCFFMEWCVFLNLLEDSFNWLFVLRACQISCLYFLLIVSDNTTPHHFLYSMRIRDIVDDASH